MIEAINVLLGSMLLLAFMIVVVKELITKYIKNK